MQSARSCATSGRTTDPCCERSPPAGVPPPRPNQAPWHARGRQAPRGHQSVQGAEHNLLRRPLGHELLRHLLRLLSSGVRGGGGAMSAQPPAALPPGRARFFGSSRCLLFDPLCRFRLPRPRWRRAYARATGGRCRAPKAHRPSKPLAKSLTWGMHQRMHAPYDIFLCRSPGISPWLRPHLRFHPPCPLMPTHAPNANANPPRPPHLLVYARAAGAPGTASQAINAVKPRWQVAPTCRASACVLRWHTVRIYTPACHTHVLLKPEPPRSTTARSGACRTRAPGARVHNSQSHAAAERAPRTVPIPHHPKQAVPTNSHATSTCLALHALCRPAS